VKKEQNERKSLRKLKPTVGCNASKRRKKKKKKKKKFISILYMFRTAMCPSSGELIVSIRHLVYVIVFR
jgi:hypothetical protein